MIKSTLKTLLCATVLICGCGCSAQKAVKVEQAQLQDQRVYDERFPIKVWTDADGAMFIEDSLAQYYPSEEQLLAAIVGRGWKPAMCYDYYKLGTTPSRWERKMFVTDKGITGWVPGVSHPLYFGKMAEERDFRIIWISIAEKPIILR